jgi:hypothetical protein
MNCIILDTIKEKKSDCFFCKATIKEYITSLPTSYRNYKIQREIINNVYLDALVDTVLEEEHIPPIILVSNNIDNIDYSGKVLILKDFEILDGLQRTHRLKIIWETVEFFIKNVSNNDYNILSLSLKELSREYSRELRNIESSTKILHSLVKYYNNNRNSNPEKKILDCFEKYQWFEVWHKVDEPIQIKKMLILNAGHKPVKAQHQLELLFNSVIPILKKSANKDFTLIREKDTPINTFSKTRKFGEFHFSHIITSIISLSDGEPITTNANLINKTQNDNFNFDKYEKYFEYDFLKLFMETLVELDKKIEMEFAQTKWLNRETSLVGIFAAVGKYAKENNFTPVESLKDFNCKILTEIEHLNILKYEDCRNSLNLSKINIGTVNKKAIYNAIYDLLKGPSRKIFWNNYFEESN